MTVRLDDSRPTYLQVADVLRDDIRRGAVQPGERLASVRELSARFDIAAVTVQSALRVLRDEGLISSRSTRGYFVNDELDVSNIAPASPEFVAIRAQLTAIESALSGLAERVSELEAAVHPEEERSSPEPPTRRRRSDT